MNSISLGMMVRTMRTLRRMNQGQLAELVGVSRYDISMLEQDKFLPPPETKAALEAALEIKFDDPDAQAAFRHLAGVKEPLKMAA